MTAQTKTTLKTYFETGDTPTAAQFADLIDTIPGALGAIADGDVPSTIARDSEVSSAVSTHNGLATAHGLTADISAALAAAINPGQSNRFLTAAEAGGGSATVFDVTDYGAVGGDTAHDRSGIQAAINACGAAGGGIVYIPVTASPYLLTAAGANTYRAGHRYCLDINHDDVHLQVEGALKLADAQQSNALGPCDIIIIGNRRRISIYGHGSITGNTAGQTGWTGGYSQGSDNGGIITSYGDLTMRVEDLLIEGLTLYDHFSNPINLGISGTARNLNITLRDLVGYNCGEGFQIICADNVIVDNCRYADLADVAVGDDIEVSSCSRFLIDRCVVTGYGPASAFDLTKSFDGMVSNFIVDKLAGDALAIQPDTSQTVTNMLICNGIVRGQSAFGIYGNTIDQITINNVYMEGAGSTISQAINLCTGGKTNVTGRIIISNCTIVGFVMGIYMQTLNNYTLSNLAIRNCTIGINWAGKPYAASAADVSNFVWDGITIDTVQYGINFDGSSTSGKDPEGVIQNMTITNAAVYQVYPFNSALLTGIEWRNYTPQAMTTPWSASAHFIAPHKYFTGTLGNDTFSTFSYPSKGQVIVIRFTQVQTIVDKTQTGGNNINLKGSVNFISAVGDRLCLEYNETTGDWVELWRRTA